MTPTPGPDALALAAHVLADDPVLDGHNDLPWAARELVRYDFDALDLAAGTRGRTHTDLPRLAAGMVGAQFWSVYVPSGLAGEAAVTATLEQVDAVHEMVRRWPDRLGLATTADEVERVTASGRVASLMGAEGGHSIDCSLGVLRMLYRLGVRYLTLTHNDNVPWADSATDTPAVGGLSEFGVEVVREMNRLGMLVDLSHVHAETMRSALAAAEAPAIFSHSSARAVCDSPRNVPDDVLGSLRDNGGLVMVTLVPDFVSQAAADWRVAAHEAATAAGVKPTDLTSFDAFAVEYRRRHPHPGATTADVVAHLEHVREVCGIDHVGIGGDYDGVPELPAGLEDVSTYPRLFAALAERGWSAEDLAKVSRRNALRVLRDAEAAARHLQSVRPPSTAVHATPAVG